MMVECQTWDITQNTKHFRVYFFENKIESFTEQVLFDLKFEEVEG